MVSASTLAILIYMTPTTTYRQQLLGQLFALYADLGWATPTSIEYARITSLEASLDVATNAAEIRGVR